MDNSEYRDTLTFLLGLAVGALIGSGAALLLAPQSGARTRRQIAHKAEELTDAATDAMGDVRDDARRIADRTTRDARRIATRARKRADETGERLSGAVEKGRDRLRR
ncbi:MAG: YtxH domain-containing protein [Gemmatimonadota bacterium]|jgi:gas vesicle protein